MPPQNSRPRCRSTSPPMRLRAAPSMRSILHAAASHAARALTTYLPLLTSRRPHRYLLLELEWRDGKPTERVGEAAILAELRDALALNFGDYGLGTALASLQVKYYNPVSSLCIVRCGREEYRDVWATLTLMTHVKGRRAMFRLSHLAGSLALCQRAAVHHERVALSELMARPPAGAANAIAAAEAAIAAMDT